MKKGFLFSLFVITALSLVVMTFRTKVEFQEERRSEIFRNRVDHVNLFIEDMEQDMERSLYVAAFRAILGANEYIEGNVEKENPYVNLDLMDGLIMNGTYNGTQMNTTNASTFGDWIERMRELSRRLNINITFNDVNVIVDQNNSWIIRVRFLSNVRVTDDEGIIEWDFGVDQFTYIDISEANFPDPMYYVESQKNWEENRCENFTGEALRNSIHRTNFSFFWYNDTSKLPCEEPLWPCVNVNNLSTYIQEQHYASSINAPSYLMRLEGDFGSSPVGIESFVNVINATSGNIWDFVEGGAETCALDYQFFSETGECANRKQIINMHDRFIIDDGDVSRYDLTNITR